MEITKTTTTMHSSKQEAQKLACGRRASAKSVQQGGHSRLQRWDRLQRAANGGRRDGGAGSVCGTVADTRSRICRKHSDRDTWQRPRCTSDGRRRRLGGPKRATSTGYRAELVCSCWIAGGFWSPSCGGRMELSAAVLSCTPCPGYLHTYLRKVCISESNFGLEEQQRR